MKNKCKKILKTSFHSLQKVPKNTVPNTMAVDH